MKSRRDDGAFAAALTLLVFVCGGCTLEEGSGFATIESATLTAELDGGADVLETSTGYSIDLARAALGIEHVLLVGELTTARPVDEAVSCDGDHCHAADGSLVSPGAATEGTLETIIAQFDVDSEVDLLAGGTVDLGAPLPSAELPGGTIHEVEVELTHVHIEGTVTGGGFGTAGIPLSVDVPVHGLLHAEVSRELSRDAPATMDVSLGIVVPAGLFSDADLESLGVSGAIEITEGTAFAAGALENVVLESALTAEL